MGLVDQWKKMSHSNLVTLRQVFTSKSFGDHSMLFVYDFYPGSETLMSKHFNNPGQLGKWIKSLYKIHSCSKQRVMNESLSVWAKLYVFYVDSR